MTPDVSDPDLVAAVEASATAQIGDHIRAARTRRGLSLRRLARDIGVSPSTMSSLETGGTMLSVQRLERIAGVLSVPVSSLVDGSTRAEVLSSYGGSAGMHDAERGAQQASTAQRSTSSLPHANQEWRSYEPLAWDPVLTAALEMFLEVGYHGAGMRAIADRAQMSVPGIYHYYASKQALLVSILDFTMADLLGRSRGALAEAARSGADPVRRFELQVENLTLFHTHRRVLGFIGVSETRSIVGDGAARLLATRIEQQEMVNREIAAGVAVGAFRVSTVEGAGRAVTSLCTSLCHWFRAGGPFRAEDVADDYVRYCLNIVGHEPGAQRVTSPVGRRPE